MFSALHQWEQKYFWRWHFKDFPGPHPYRVKSNRIPDYPYPPPDRVSAFTQDVSECVLETCRLSVNRFHKQRQTFYNRSAVVKWNLEILKNGSIGTLPCDKDGGFCFKRKQTILDMKLDCVNNSKYAEIVHTISRFEMPSCLMQSHAKVQLERLKMTIWLLPFYQVENLGCSPWYQSSHAQWSLTCQMGK